MLAQPATTESEEMYLIHIAMAREEGVKRVVYTSSVSCIGEAPPEGLASEDTPCKPSNKVGT